MHKSKLGLPIKVQNTLKGALTRDKSISFGNQETALNKLRNVIWAAHGIDPTHHPKVNQQIIDFVKNFILNQNK